MRATVTSPSSREATPGRFRRLARLIRSWTGSATAAVIVFGVAAAWLVLGALTRYPRWWELLVTAGVPFVTLLMVVLLQHTQNHDDRATQLKLDELIRASHTATNRMMTVEDASRGALDRIHDDFQAQADRPSRVVSMNEAPRVFDLMRGDATETRSSPFGAVGLVHSGEGIEVVWVSKQAEQTRPGLVLDRDRGSPPRRPGTPARGVRRRPSSGADAPARPAARSPGTDPLPRLPLATRGRGGDGLPRRVSEARVSQE